MNKERMMKYFGDLVPTHRIEIIAESDDLSEEKVEDEYLNITIQHVPTYRRRQMRVTKHMKEEAEKVCAMYELRKVRKDREIQTAF